MLFNGLPANHFRYELGILFGIDDDHPSSIIVFGPSWTNHPGDGVTHQSSVCIFGNPRHSLLLQVPEKLFEGPLHILYDLADNISRKKIKKDSSEFPVQ